MQIDIMNGLKISCGIGVYQGQRYFGVPFPVWYCKECGEPIFARKEDLL